MATIAELESLKAKLSVTAKKWVLYLATLEDDDERVKELTRLLLETSLEASNLAYENAALMLVKGRKES